MPLNIDLDFKVKLILFQDFRGFENLNVLVIGIGNSASDVACELSRHAKHVSIEVLS